MDTMLTRLLRSVDAYAAGHRGDRHPDGAAWLTAAPRSLSLETPFASDERNGDRAMLAD